MEKELFVKTHSIPKPVDEKYHEVVWMAYTTYINGHRVPKCSTY